MKAPRLVLASLFIATQLAYAAATPAATDTHLPPGIAWKQGDVAAAFVQAKATKKPLFLYWGAGWCPPCNQVKATIFNQQAFIERTRQFIPVYLDGDSPNAQKLGAQFKVRGYPTMILFKPDGTEITRLPGEVDADRYLQVLTLGLTAARPVKTTLANALQDGSKLSADEWRLLADYSWETDEAQLVAKDKLASTLQTVSKAVPVAQGDTATRLQLKALALSAGDKTITIDQTASLALLNRVLADAKLARTNFDVLVNYATDLVETTSAEHTAERTALAASFRNTLQQLSLDSTVSTADRLSAVNSMVSLAKLEAGKAPLSDALLKTVRDRVAEADKATTNAYERHVVITNAADTLSTAGLLDESDSLLKAELQRSHSPYYLMLDLAANAKQRGDKVGALSWYEQAYNASTGPATRLQWGVTYLSNLLELAPQDEAKVDAVAGSVLKEAAAVPNAFYERNGRSLEKLVAKLNNWNKTKQHDASVQKVLAQIQGMCGKLPSKDPQRSSCEALLKPV